MIAIELVIDRIAKATRGDREIDYMIALVMGWRRVEKPSSAAKAPTDRTLWLIPSGKEESKVPTYTSNLQDAYRLALQVAPRVAAGCSWEPDKATAQFYGESPFQAATPILALCGASMALRLRQIK